MSRYYKNSYTILFALILIAFVAPLEVNAQDHVVPGATIHQALVNSAAARRKNVAQIEEFFSSAPVRNALNKSPLNLRQVENAIPSLSNQELAQLATRTEKVQNEFAAGSLSNEDLTYIVIALATAVIVILIVKA